MAYTIQNAKDDLSGITHSTEVESITNIFGAFNRAARTVLLRLDPAETRRIAPLTNPIHDQEYYATAPSDLKGKKIIDIRPQVNRSVRDNFTSVPSSDFDLRKALEDNTFLVQHNDGSKSLRINKTLSSRRTVIAPMNTITEDGAWSVGGAASALALDAFYYVSGSASFKMTVANGANTLDNTTMSSKDLTNFDEVGTFLIRVYISTVSSVTSFDLRWGNDLIANYWNSTTVTAQADGTAFRVGWNVLKFEWNGATETGVVSPSTIDSFRLTTNTTGTLTDFRVDNLVVSLGFIYETEYYSKYLFRTPAGIWIENCTDDSDIVNLDTESYNIWLYETALLLAQQNQGADFAADLSFFTNELYGQGNKIGLYDKYFSDNPTEAIRQTNTYYRPR